MEHWVKIGDIGYNIAYHKTIVDNNTLILLGGIDQNIKL